jgi:hypothetical protein
MELFKNYESENFIFLTHVFADIELLRRLIREFPWRGYESWIYVSLLETALIKARSVGDFLVNPTDRESDIKASHFIEDWNSDAELFKDLDLIVNKQVAHLTKQRFINGDSKKAETSESILRLLNLVLAEVERFENELKLGNSKLWEEMKALGNLY